MSTEHAEPGRLLVGRYRLDEIIGEGGMGRVWRGTDELLDRPVAVKELNIPPHLPGGEVDILRTRMLREARSAARLSHPSIITVFDVVESDDRPWIVMELVRGPSLSDLVREGVLPPQRAAAIGVQVVAALAVAHNAGIVHRDIKPGNVLIASGDRAVLTDFGIARLEGTTDLTSTGLLVGSPSYLAPEQAHGKGASPATDMWSLGVTLFQAVEGTLPFQRPTAMATLTAIVTEDVPTPVAAGPLRSLLERLLAKAPSGRPSVAEAHRILRDIVADGGGQRSVEGPTRDSATTLAATPGADPGVGSAESGHAASDPVGAPASLYEPVLPPGPGDSGARPRRNDRAPARALIMGAAAALALVLAIGAGFWLGDSGPTLGAATPESDASSPGATDKNAADKETDKSSPSPSPEKSDDPNMKRHDDETGFSVDVPKGWEVERRDNGVFFRNPDGGYVQVDQTDDPGKNAKADWEKQEGSISQNFQGYELVDITALKGDAYDPYISAADWEFTFAGDRHAVNRAFHTEKKGYALFLVSPEEDFAENKELLDSMMKSFEPAG